MSKEYIQVGIYYIDTSLFDRMTNDDVAKRIIEVHNGKIGANLQHGQLDGKEKFHEQQLRTNVVSDNFKVRIFYSAKRRTPKWKDFLKPILASDQDLLKANNHDSSYIGFIYDDDHLFAISGGQGNFLIQDYVDQNFGIRLLSCLINKDSRVIKSLQDRGLTGSVLASTRFFRGDAKLADEEEFGKIYKQIQAELGAEILSKEFGFTSDEIRGNVGCVAKSSFQINKAIDFCKLLQILANISRVLNENDEPSTLNQVEVINRRGEKNKKLIVQLENILFEQLYENFLDNSSEVDFDFCHPDYENYLTANSYQIFKGSSHDPLLDTSIDKMDNVRLLLKSLKEENKFKSGSFEEFKSSLTNLKIKSFNNDNQELTKGSFSKHVHGEIKCHDKTYFHIDGEWYEIKSAFLENLNTDCKTVICDSVDQNILDKLWLHIEPEGTYIQKYLNEERFLVLHRVLAENIELCDLLKFDDSNLHVIHIKKGFDNSTRDLTCQIMIAAKRIIEDIKGNSFSYLTQVYESLKAKSSSEDCYLQMVSAQTKKISENEFLQIFREKKVCFTLAFVDTAENERDIIGDIRRFDSNIAKFSVIELKRNLRRLGVDLKIAQIKRA